MSFSFKAFLSKAFLSKAFFLMLATQLAHALAVELAEVLAISSTSLLMLASGWFSLGSLKSSEVCGAVSEDVRILLPRFNPTTVIRVWGQVHQRPGHLRGNANGHLRPMIEFARRGV